VTFQSPGSILLQLGPLAIRWYGFLIALGAVIACSVATKLAKRFQFDLEHVLNCVFWCFIGGIIGARLYYVALKWEYFLQHLNEIPATWLGGLSIHGGLLGATICGAIYCRKVKLPILPMSDLISVCVPLAQAIGRWGNFFNSELFGRPVGPDFFLRLYIPPENRPLDYREFSYFHPTFLYESIWDLLLFCLLYFVVVNKTRAYPGLTFMIYLAGYSLGRMLIEPLRIDGFSFVAGMQTPVVISAVFLAGSIIGMVLILKRGRQPQVSPVPKL
jgi:phosphatidylglycerol---prolipoprotein diacylglyceryl transferase